MPTARHADRLRVVTLLALAVLLVGFSMACSGDDDSPDAGDRGASNESDEATGGADSSEDADPAPTATEVEAITLTVEDPDLGELTFDALAAGDPSAASEGRLVLLLHGFPETAESYREILLPLAEAGYYAVAPSQRGYSPGARPDGVEPYGILNLVGDVVAMADTLGADRFHVAGHDWGGAVAWVTAAVHRDRVQTLTALSTPHPDPFSDGIADPNHEQSQASSYMAILREPGSEDQLLAAGAESFIAGIGLPADKAATYAEVLDTPEALGAALNWYRATPIPTEARIGPVGVPTLYMWGTEDIAFTRSTAEATVDYVDAPYTFVEIPGGSHWLPEEEPDRIATAMLDHLATHGG
jgi:pimeloyl-ACP methyl ester carboxylesterase